MEIFDTLPTANNVAVTRYFAFALVLMSLLCSTSSFGQDSLELNRKPGRLADIIKQIADVNEVQSEHIGVAGTQSVNYQNYLRLKKSASTGDLLILLDNKNAVVACYAGLALADQSYPNLLKVFLKFLSKDRKVSTMSGCIQSKQDISSELYHQYWNNVEDKERATDKILRQLDSAILYRDNSYWLLMSRALENRVYPSAYKKRIEELAFKKSNQEALFYLCTWYRADNYDNIKKALVKYLQKTDFSTTGITDYYRTIDELLKFRDSEIESLIVQKLRKDKHWKYDDRKFKSLLEDYSIYEKFD
jgi:hypothetical protein